MRLEDFIDQVCRDRPATLSLHDLANVHPPPWVTRRGGGKQTRMRMAIGQKVWYERQAGDECWHRVDDGSEFDLMNPVST